jgi:hypothetical protein
LLSLVVEALSANWHVNISTANKFNCIASGSPKGETGWVATYFANSLQLLDLFTFGNQVEDVVKGFAEGSAAQD